MRNGLLAGALALSVLLTGCSALLEREYSSVTPHNAVPATEGDSATLRADSYQGLVNALVYLVSGGAEKGTVRLYTKTEDVEPFLADACREVVQEDPLGAYCVERIDYSVDPVVAYSEAHVSIAYRRTREQVASIVQATGITAIRGELESALASFATERVLRVSYFEEDEDYIRDLARQAYYDAPACALGMPEVNLTIYPGSGRQRIVEILLDYPLERAELEKRRGELAWELQLLTRDLAGDGQKPQPLDAAYALLKEGEYNPEGGNTPYDFLNGGEADSEGISLAFAALCHELSIPCHVVQGTRDGESHFWSVVQTGEGWRHLDLSALEGTEEPLYTDQAVQELGYLWEEGSVPACAGD